MPTDRKQPNARIQFILNAFILAEDSLELSEREMLGEYLRQAHGAQLHVAKRIFVPVAASPFHLREISPPEERKYSSVSIFDGQPFRGPLIGLYSAVARNGPDSAESTDPKYRVATEGGRKRGTLGALLFGATEASGLNVWPHRHPWGSAAQQDDVRKYFANLQIIPGISAAKYLHFSVTREARSSVEVESMLDAIPGHPPAGLFWVNVDKVVGNTLYLSKEYDRKKIEVCGHVRYPGWGRRFQTALGLVSYADTEDQYCFRDAFILPLVSPQFPIPSESGLEANVLAPLASWVESENRRGRKIYLKKPLFCSSIGGELVRLDAELHDIESGWRFGVEVLGFGPERKDYHQRKDRHAHHIAGSGYAAVQKIRAYELKSRADWRNEMGFLFAAIRSSSATHKSKVGPDTSSATG
ncbi:MAG TPA: hypothetical protein VGD88_04530 [Opitutaceae bacterium]